VAVLQKLDVHTNKWTYIARKQNIHLTTKQHSTSATNRIQGTINRIQDTKQKNKQNTKKQQNTQKQQNMKTRKKLLPGIETGPLSL
jgi:hypothetical protein